MTREKRAKVKMMREYEPWHVISINVAFLTSEDSDTSLCSLLLSIKTPNCVQSVA